MSDIETNNQENETSKESSKKPLIMGILIGSFVSMAGLGGTYYIAGPKLLPSPSAPAHATEAVVDSAACHALLAAEAVSTPKPTYQIPNIIVNPANSSGFLMLSLAVETSSEQEVEQLMNRDLVIRDRILRLISSKTMDELATLEVRDSLRDEISAVLVEMFPEVKIGKVLFPQYVLQ